MKRWRAGLPRFRTPIILQREHDGPSSRIGNHRLGSNIARVLKRFSTVSPSGVDLPSVPAPANHFVAPGTYATDWTAWWGAVPDPLPRGEYRIPDPPTTPRPVLPNRENPVLWEAYAEVGTNVWETRISAVYVHCEWQPKTGKEQMAGMSVLEIQEAALKIRPSIIKTAGINPREWNVLRVEEDNEDWQLLAITPSFRRKEFVELMVKRTEK